MPIDARIPLGVTPIDPNSFSNALAAGMKMRELQNAGQRLDLADDRLARKDEAAVRKSNALSEFGQSDRGPEAVKKLYRDAPDAAPAAEKNTREAQFADIQAKQKQAEWAKANHQLLADASGAILANGTREYATMVLDSLEAEAGPGTMSVPRKQLESTKVDAALPGLFKGWVGNAKRVQEMALAEEKAGQPDVLMTPSGPIDRKNPQGGVIDVPGVVSQVDATRASQDYQADLARKETMRKEEVKRAAVEYKQSRLTPQAAQKTREKLQTLDVIDAQLGKVEDAFMGPKNPDGTRKPGGIQNSYSAGLGAGYLPTQGGQEFDAAVDALRPFLRQLSRTPGEGAMSDYETRQAEALLPSRNAHESVTKQKIQQLRDIAKQIRSGLAAPAAPAPAPAGRPAPAMVPGADPGVTRDQVEAEMRRRGLILP